MPETQIRAPGVRSESRTHAEVAWHTVFIGWVIGTAALVLLLLSVTGYGTGPGGLLPLRSLLWLWILVTAFAGAWYLLLRAVGKRTT